MDLNKYRHLATGSCAYFTDILTALTAHIQDSKRVYGCIAWLTERSVLNALEKIPCSIIVQQEDWNHYSRQNCITSYNKLTPVPYTYFQQFKNISCLRDNYTEKAIRSIGSPETANTPTALPRMHHKFLIMEKNNGAVGVWTGSFNFTKNATNSLENAVFITDEKIVQQYRDEFIHLLCLSGELTDIWTPERYYSLREGNALQSLKADMKYVSNIPKQPSPETVNTTPMLPATLGLPMLTVPSFGIVPSTAGDSLMWRSQDDMKARYSHDDMKARYSEHEPPLVPIEPIKCAKCGKSNHTVDKCWKVVGKPVIVPARPDVCSLCDRFGHDSAACFAKFKLDGTPLPPRVCSRCDRIGHNAKDCHAKTRADGTLLSPK